MQNVSDFIKPLIFGTIFNLLVYPIFLIGFIAIYFALYQRYPLSEGFISFDSFWANFIFIFIYTFIISIIIGFLLSLTITLISPQTIYRAIAITALFALFVSMIIRPPIIVLINYILHQDGDYELEMLKEMLQIFISVFCQTFLTGVFVTKLKAALEN
jgi:hypothetical protein